MFDMAAVASHFHRSNCPRGPSPHGVQQQQAHEPHLQAHQSSQEPPAGPGVTGQPGPQRVDEPHQKPFFYVQPPQQFMPMQWPLPLHLPMGYNPYYSYPGPGYGMPMMPHYQSNPYMEPPAFIMPHSNMHLMDYRRLLTPQYYQTMAYHSRRFRYQQNGPNREVASSEVQTEPLSASLGTSTEVPARPCVPPTSVCGTQQQTSTVQKVDRSQGLNELRTPQNGGFMIQTEEVHIECCTTPVGLQLLHSQTAEVSHQFSKDVVQCSSVVQGHISPEEGPVSSLVQLEQAPQVCPDILLVGSGSGDGMLKKVSNYENRKVAEDDLQFNVVHLPFDPKYLEELQKIESSVWSTDETLMASPCSLIQNLNSEFECQIPKGDQTLTPDEGLPEIEEPPLEEPQDVASILMDLPKAEESTHLKASQQPGPYLQSSLTLEEKTPQMVDGNQKSQDHQDTSFESLPTYLPSTSWLSDFDGLHYCKQPLMPLKQSEPSTRGGLDVPDRRRNLNLEYRDISTMHKPKERYKMKGKVERRSLSDHECCLGRPHQKMFDKCDTKMERLCMRCMNKQRVRSIAATGLEGMQVQSTSKPDLRVHDAEGESSENSASLKWSFAPRDPLKRPLAPKQNLQQSPVKAKLRKKNCWCSELQCPPGVWKKLRCCPHGKTIREMDENFIRPPQDQWRNLDQIHMRPCWQTERSSCKTVASNGISFQRCQAQPTKKSTSSQSQGVQRKDTRC